MDKGTYETYEFLPTNNVGTEADQFFVMQDDGTFLITKQIQYVTQQQENKPIAESTDTCTVFDVPAQQFYVNVNGSTEFIVPEQLILPEGTNNLYTSSYLLQSEPMKNPEQPSQMEEDVTDQYKEATTEGAVETNNKQTNNCTEITLSDEQYQTLEQKGWILLEANDKIFVLNTLGLHDITTNDKLIHKLKNEIQNNANVDIDAGCLRADLVPNTAQDPVSNQASVEFVVANDDAAEKNTQNVCFDVVDKEGTGDEQVKDENSEDKNDIQSPSAAVQNETIEVFREQDSNSIRIKTKFIFNNISNKILLGKTANGKRIVAKVVKKNKTQPAPDKIVENKQLGGPDIDEAQFLGLVHQALRSYSSTFFAEDVPAANGVIVQLLKVPALRQSIIDKNIIVTKIRTTKGNDDEMHKSKISLLTGKVKLSNDNKECFTHIPNLLHNLLSTRGSKDNNNTKTNKATNISDTLVTNDLSIFHIHVSEVVCEDNLVRVHINLAKRQFAVDSVLNFKSRKPQTTYACGSCATMFKTPQALEEHQEVYKGQCVEVEDNLTIDIDVINKNKETYSIIKNGKEKLYSCLQCDATFPRISHCQKHVKTHFAPTDSEKGDSEQMDTDKEKEIYKCKMCPATFYHQSTLSRHIVTRHIKLKKN